MYLFYMEDRSNRCGKELSKQRFKQLSFSWLGCLREFWNLGSMDCQVQLGTGLCRSSHFGKFWTKMSLACSLDYPWAMLYSNIWGYGWGDFIFMPLSFWTVWLESQLQCSHSKEQNICSSQLTSVYFLTWHEPIITHNLSLQCLLKRQKLS